MYVHLFVFQFSSSNLNLIGKALFIQKKVTIVPQTWLSWKNYFD